MAANTARAPGSSRAARYWVLSDADSSALGEEFGSGEDAPSVSPDWPSVPSVPPLSSGLLPPSLPPSEPPPS